MMMPANKVLQLVGQTHEFVGRAAKRWDATDLSRVEECLQALERSVAAMQHACDILKNGNGNSATTLRSGVLGLKNDVARMELLVDASAAFLRGIAGGAGPAYGSGGQILTDAAVAESHSMQA